MIEDVINPRNMQQACIQVVRNKGSAGVDGMSVNALKDYVRRNRVQIAGALKQGDYRPQPILGVAIPKSNGKMRFIPESAGGFVYEIQKTKEDECSRKFRARRRSCPLR